MGQSGRRFGLLLWGALAAGAGTASAEPVLLDGARDWVDLRDAVEVLSDPTGRLAIDAVAGSPRGSWGPAGPLPRRGGRRILWVRLQVELRGTESGDYLLMPEWLWDDVQLYTAAPGGVWEVVRSGQLLPLRARALPLSTLALPLRLEAGQPVTGYLRLESDVAGYAPPRGISFALVTEAGFRRREARNTAFNGIYTGVILAVALYYLFLYGGVGEKIYLHYVLYAGAFGSIWILRSGLPLEHLWPDAPGWNRVSTFYSIAGAVVFGNRFVQAFLETRRRTPRLHLLLHALGAGALVAGALGLAARWLTAERILASVSLMACLAYGVAGVTTLRQGYRPARIYLIACGAPVLATLLYVLVYFGVLPRTFATLYGVQIGSAAEVVLLAFALGDRINLLRSEKTAAEERYRQGLESEVQARTVELAEANRRLRKAYHLLARLSRRDELTGLANRRHLENVLSAEWRRCLRNGHPLSLVLLDVDHFKDYNDRYGHLAGDRCLQEVTAALAERCQRAGDLLARYGGEEFVVLLPGTDREGAALMAERLRQAVEDLAHPHLGAGSPGVITISAGVATLLPSPETSTSELLAEADAALYAAKWHGRNRVMAGSG